MKNTAVNQPKKENAKLALTIGAIATGLVLSAGVPAMSSGHGDGDRPELEFTQIDADSNGEITQEEFAAFRMAHKAERFSGADTNGDGMLSVEELTEASGKRAERRIGRMIERFDENGDGMLSMDEMPERRKGRQDSNHGRHANGNSESMMDRFDTDDNGTISIAEFEAAKENMQNRHGNHGN